MEKQYLDINKTPQIAYSDLKISEEGIFGDYFLEGDEFI